MLNSISIKNIALIDDITINLNNQLNVITGETGAGKSLVIDSIALLLGAAADRSLISYDVNYAYVEAVFTTNSQKILDIMEQLGLDRENTIVVSRKIYREGKNECKVNGKNFTLSMLKKLTTPLMDLHGQFEHQSLLDSKYQLSVIDLMGGAELLDLKQQFSDEYHNYKQIQKQLSEFTESDEERFRLLDLYQYQIEEITQANFIDGEEESLKEFRQKVLNIEKIESSLNNACILASEGQNSGGGIVENITRLMGLLQGILAAFKPAEEIYERLSSSKIEIADIIDTLEAEKNQLEFNQDEAKINEERLDLLSTLKKKYGRSIAEINEYLKNIQSEYDRLVDSEDYIAKLKAQKVSSKNRLLDIGGRLSELRKRVAKNLEVSIKKELVSLAMKNTSFFVDFINVEFDNIDETGLNQVEYMFSANTGVPPKPLSKIISGGEMSRFMLAVKNITCHVEDIETMIFDEIDTGVSGLASEELAKKMLAISVNKQVICVSHLSQVASFATTHYYINKELKNGKTVTKIRVLNDADRINEIARLIGGTISQHSIEHAKIMVKSAADFLKTLK